MKYPLLDGITDPQRLKAMDLPDLEALAEEIRRFIVGHVSATGGHLASNLGVVELTLALHKIFDSPRDKIIWDVGHQSYVHKILTGRREGFSKLRCFGGLSGFPKRSESVHDVFETGHSSTSVSAALGIARGRDLFGEDFHALAVIGDGAISGGLAFEALNDAGHSKTNLIVLLNDNEMSIAKNVGALSTHLAKIRSHPRYHWVKKEVEAILRRIPGVGDTLFDWVERFKNSAKYFVVPGVLFEEMGFTYLGPIDGHSLPRLMAMLQEAKALQGPILLHVITQKGRGYPHAEEKPALFHGVGPFHPDTGCLLHPAQAASYSAAFGWHLADLAARDNRITAITAAMPDGTGLTLFQKRFPKRFFDVGIAEGHAVTLAAGMAASGLRPVAAVYSTFLQRAYDQILHDVCQQNLPVVFAVDRAGLVGEDGETHQGVFDLSYLRAMPNLTLMAPKNTDELKAMLELALTLNGPAAIRYPKTLPKSLEGTVGPPMTDLSWEVLRREGTDAALLAVGPMAETALRALAHLKAARLSVMVINARVIKPLDTALLRQTARLCRHWVTLEDNCVQGGFGSAVNEFVMAEGLPVSVLNLGIPDRFVPHGSVEELQRSLGLDPEGVCEKILGRFGAVPEQTYV